MKNSAITYNLIDDKNSNNYYSFIREFTDKVLIFSKNNLNYELTGYSNYLKKNGNARSNDEHLFDFLLLAVLWNVYAKRSLKLNSFLAGLLSFLFNLRQNHKSVKPLVDKIRGFLFAILLSNNYDNDETPETNYSNLLSLTKWLKATGEFKEEVKRIELISAYLKEQESFDRENFLYRLSLLGGWFRTKSKQSLSQFTLNVNWFVGKRNSTYKFREDYIFTGRNEVEYHLNMVGAEIMNRVFKPDFVSTSKKIVLLPACMRKFNNERCKALRDDLELICTGCNFDCNVNKYKNKGLLENFEVRIIPHSSDFTTWIEKMAKGKNIGVVGVACPLNLIQGGLELKGLDIPAQCILLDYCGCKNHWDENGLTTDLNTYQLSEMMRC